jgi:4-diphosphocytidyl-2-C-methyl-D-erythritol kinase
MLAVAAAPAKLNLALELVGRRPDGFHLLAAVSQTVAWSDLVAAALNSGPPEPGGIPVAVRGPFRDGIPEGPENIAARAAGALQRRGLGRGVASVAIWKRIPTKSGLGGGSSDAAAVLRLSAGDDWSVGVAEAALECGADVPFALRGGAALLGGVGELLTPLPPLAPTVILVAVLGAVETARAYASVRSEELTDGSRAAAVAEALRKGDLPGPELLGSALQAAALRVAPELSPRLERLQAAAPHLSWAMTGSGGAFFALVGAAEAGPVLAACRAALPGVPIRATAPA